MYGNTSIGKISLLMCVIIPLYNISSVIILAIYSDNNKNDKITLKDIIKHIVKNPLIIGSVSGLIMVITQLKLPKVIEVPIDQLSKLAIPLALFIIGGDFKIKMLQCNFIKVITITIVRLIIIPIIMIIISIYLGLRNINLAIILCVFATPTATASCIMAKNMHGDYNLAVQIVILTTACSCITIFFLIYFLCTHGYIKIM
ncbi:MAG: AEC family transporter [Bacteroidales bacterium OttesenSCG-928-I14]|jgi:predicted permease|nr:AEC family transporter [Bacteroidales bacterium OttesenSCG-928-I14]